MCNVANMLYFGWLYLNTYTVSKPVSAGRNRYKDSSLQNYIINMDLVYTENLFIRVEEADLSLTDFIVSQVVRMLKFSLIFKKKSVS